MRDDGTIGISYYDFRNNTTDPATLLTDYWLARSSDGVTWRETHIAGTFDPALAPNAEGLFLGDYQALASIDDVFLPFYVHTNTNDLANRSDVFSMSAGAAGAVTKDTTKEGVAHQGAETVTRAAATALPEITPQMQQRIGASIRRALQRRMLGRPPSQAGTPPTFASPLQMLRPLPE